MSISQFPTQYKERGGYLAGLGLSANFDYFPLDDLAAMKVRWLRLDSADVLPNAAQIDAMIAYYEKAGYRLTWQLPATPVTAGAYNVPSALGKLIVSRYQAAGLGPPALELGNEVVQLNTQITFTFAAGQSVTAGAQYTDGAGNTFAALASEANSSTWLMGEIGNTGSPAATGTLTLSTGSGDSPVNWTSVSYGFANVNAAAAAFVTLLSSWQSAMAGYPHLCIALNDEAAYVKTAYDACVTAGGPFPDCWGMHDYQWGANGGNAEPATLSLVQEIAVSSVIHTEGGYVSNTASKANCKTFFEGMWTAMGELSSSLPWNYYVAYDAGYNAAGPGYGWYTGTLQGPDAVGIYSVTKAMRTATLTEIAADLGIALP